MCQEGLIVWIMQCNPIALTTLSSWVAYKKCPYHVPIIFEGQNEEHFSYGALIILREKVPDGLGLIALHDPLHLCKLLGKVIQMFELYINAISHFFLS